MVFAETERLPRLVPLAGTALSQEPLTTVAVQLKVPPPVFDTVTDCAGGFASDCRALKATELVLIPIAGGAEETVSVTVMVCGVLLAPAAAT